MPFKVLPVPQTYISVADVTDPDTERLKVTLFSGEVIVFKLTQLRGGDFARLDVDQDLTNPAILDELYRRVSATYAKPSQYTEIFGFKHWVRKKKRTPENIRREMQLYFEVRPSDNFGHSPSTGDPLTIMAGIINDGASSCRVGNGSLIVKIESIVIK